jgi:hypothetical protein
MISSKSAYIARFLVIRRDGERLEEFPLHARRLMDIANEISERAETLEDDRNVIQWKLDKIVYPSLLKRRAQKIHLNRIRYAQTQSR